MIYFFCADGNGYDSVADIVAAHKDKVTVIELISLNHFEEVASKLMDKMKDGDYVVVDTVSSLANTARGDFKLGIDPSINYYEKREKYFGDKNYQTNYEAAGQMIMRRLKDLKGAGAKIIVTVHEKEVKDETVVPPITKRGPDLNPAFISSLVGSSSDVFRLKVNYEPVVDNDGKVKFPAKSRMLQLGPSDEFVSKYHVPLDKTDKLPSAISRPSYTKLCKVLGKTPTFLTVYAPPGSGKSTFCLSMLADPDGKGLGI